MNLLLGSASTLKELISKILQNLKQVPPLDHLDTYRDGDYILVFHRLPEAFWYLYYGHASRSGKFSEAEAEGAFLQR